MATDVSEQERLEVANLDTVPGKIARALQERLDELERGALEAGRLRPGNEGDAARYTHAIGEVRDALEMTVALARDGIDTIETMGPGKPTEAEWLAWRHLCGELEKSGIRVNGLADSELSDRARDVIRATKRWGEELVGLRLTQGSHTISRARDEARDAYPEGGEVIE